jgi:hypothetical protein
MELYISLLRVVDVGLYCLERKYSSSSFSLGKDFKLSGINKFYSFS